MKSDDDTITVKVQRYTPTVDGTPRFETYRVPSRGRLRVTDVLEYIHETLDPTLAYRRQLCREGFCLGCYMLINGIPRPACLTKLEKELVLEPAPEYEVIKDLVVDFSKKKVTNNSDRQHPG